MFLQNNWLNYYMTKNQIDKITIFEEKKRWNFIIDFKGIV